VQRARNKAEGACVRNAAARVVLFQPRGRQPSHACSGQNGEESTVEITVGKGPGKWNVCNYVYVSTVQSAEPMFSARQRHVTLRGSAGV